jgi:hypothetical protein
MKAIEEKNPILGWNSIDLSSKLRPSDAEVASLGPKFQAAWEKDFKDEPSRPLMLMGVVSSFLGDPSLVHHGLLHRVSLFARLHPYHGQIR